MYQFMRVVKYQRVSTESQDVDWQVVGSGGRGGGGY